MHERILAPASVDQGHTASCPSYSSLAAGSTTESSQPGRRAAALAGAGPGALPLQLPGVRRLRTGVQGAQTQQGFSRACSVLNRRPAEAGLRELVDAEPRFEPYTRSLFGPGALGLDRDARSADENARLDGLLAGFLQLLSGFFLAPGASKALEFLIRQYRRAPLGRLAAPVTPWEDGSALHAHVSWRCCC